MRGGVTIACVLAVCGVAEAASPVCLTKSEARTRWPSIHLYWVNTNVGRCWTNTRGSGRRVKYQRREDPQDTVEEAPPLPSPKPPAPLPYVPPELVPVVPPAGPFKPWFDRVLDAAAGGDGEQIIFSTFDGEPPDVWPELPRDTSSQAFEIGMILAASAVAGFLLSDVLLRWKETKVHNQEDDHADQYKTLRVRSRDLALSQV